jgi:hypothetical protein
MKVEDLIKNLKSLNANAEVLIEVTRIQTSPKDHDINVVGTLEEIASPFKDNTVTLKGEAPPFNVQNATQITPRSALITTIALFEAEARLFKNVTISAHDSRLLDKVLKNKKLR